LRKCLKAVGWRQYFAVLLAFQPQQAWLQYFEEPDSMQAKGWILLDHTSSLIHFTTAQIDSNTSSDNHAGSYFAIASGGFVYPLSVSDAHELARWVECLGQTLAAAKQTHTINEFV
jgi:hypothetical protein